ncbi:MAG TPA: PAS domain-containing sensor histidine kinase [Candidatus Saccharimonadales bacterium]|nr:PAS domain-containing sensor histidine kinase [Candidatus Saccharimonadales bacterium]
MDHLQKFAHQVRNRQIILLLFNNIVIVGAWWWVSQHATIDPQLLLYGLIALGLTSSVILGLVSSSIIVKPVTQIWQAIMHVAPDTANIPPPKLTAHAIGAELVGNLVSHIYQLANVVGDVEKLASKNTTDLKNNFVANSIPLPLMVLDNNQTVLFANKAMCDYLDRSDSDTIGQNVYSVLDLSFGTDETFDKWLANAKANDAVASNIWERVRLNLSEGRKPRQFDLAAYYNQNNPEGFETMLVMFDHTQSYSQDDQALSFVALAVHELRTPVTLLRGYIEALEEDLEGKLSPEMTDFMHKMKAAAESLTAFINNMLNVSRIESDQLVLKLHEEKWPEIVRTAVSDLSLRARIQGIELVVNVDEGLPAVGVDRVGVYEVLVNLVDNAIKYSGGRGKKVTIKSVLNKEGLVETTVQDSGAGIPTNLISNLFDKFYRSHRSRNQVGGTGLGLYLSKSIIEAHGGNIWVRSREGQGSTFGFTIRPYVQLADGQKNGDNSDITRGAHGWIKNHSLYSG